MEILESTLLIFAGIAAGFINTLAGNGSLITLTILLEFIGLPALTANGTNRVGIFFHSIITSYSMQQSHAMNMGHAKRILPIMFIGGICGGVLSVIVSPEQFKFVYRFLLIALFITLFINPKKWLEPERFSKKLPPYIKAFILFCVGVYGGFIQMGMGIVLLAVLVLFYQIPLLQANTIKLFSVLVYTPIVFAILIFHDLVNWHYGLLLAAGQIIGGWITARYISRWKHANHLAYILLLIMVSAALIKIFLFP